MHVLGTNVYRRALFQQILHYVGMAIFSGQMQGLFAPEEGSRVYVEARFNQCLDLLEIPFPSGVSEVVTATREDEDQDWQGRCNSGHGYANS